MPPATILLADDEAHITCVVGAKLRSAGYTVVTARDGEEAFELARSSAPDLVITDLQMPRMSGLELARALKNNPATSKTPVIMLTARGFIAEPAEIAKTNIARMISKPFGAREVLKNVTELLSATDVDAARRDREAA